MGLALILANAFIKPTLNLNLLIYAILASFAIFSIFSGFQIIENKPKALLFSAICQAMQIPFFYTKIFSYLLSMGLLGAIYFQRYPKQVKFGFEFRFGCSSELHILQEMNLTIGINLTALFLFIYLLNQIKQRSNKRVDFTVKTPVDEVAVTRTESHP